MAGFALATRMPLLAALLLAAFPSAALAHHHDTSTAIVTKAPIYLPYYNDKAWSMVQGSIISENETANETTYTIFCPAQTAPTCDLSLEFPFIIVEGPSTLRFSGTYTSTYIADLDCKLNGTTAATCSGYTSYKSGYTDGPFHGPTQVSWTSTYSGAQVNWGTLTLADPPTATGDSPAFSPTATAASTPTTDASGILSLPTATPESIAPGLSAPRQRWSCITTLSAIVVAALMS